MKGRRGKLWFEFHSWVGLKLSLVMSFILITGTLAVVSNELDWLTHASMRVEPRPLEEYASWGDLYAALVKAYPGWEFSYLREPVDPWFTVLAYGITPDGRTRLVDIDPYTAEVKGDRDWLSFQRFFRNTHRHLMLPTKIGVPIVSALSLLLIASTITGLVVYKKFWRGLFKMPRAKRTTRIFNGDLHRLVALWSLWFVPVIALTGLFYLAESLGWRAPPFGAVDKSVAGEYTLSGKAVDRYARRAREILPGLRIAMVLPPTRAGDPLVFRGYTDNTWLVRPRASYVAFDPATGDVVGSHRSKRANWHQRLAEMADPLHFGYFGGWPTKLIWFIFGGLLSVMSITGVIVYATRLRHAERQFADGGESGPGRWWRNAWQGMGPWKWTGVIAIAIVIALTPVAARSASVLVRLPVPIDPP